ncbi:MAG TPA: hypothetical protein GXX36_05895 [Clostridiaceae bacterium]|nr:hypothetical protein [Clostridiaceae bacterium]HHV99091.1 hypothetical protein [Clostridiaceae bacterium]
MITPATLDGYVFDEDMYSNQPGIHELLREMNEKVLSKYDIVCIGETLNVNPETARLYSDEVRKEIDMVCNSELMFIDAGPKWKWDVIPWKLTDFKRIIEKWQVGLFGKGWSCLYFSNHDQPRMVSRFGNDTIYRKESAKLLATLLLTIHGTPFIYQGEEIGMTNVRFSSIEDYRDVETLNFFKEAVNSGWPVEKVMEAIYCKGRDNVRTPMQLNDEKNAGFTKGEPWIKVNPNYKEINVAQSSTDPDSVLNYYKKLIQIRKNLPVLIYGEFNLILEDDEQIFAYTRKLGNDKVLVILNFSNEYAWFNSPESVDQNNIELLISNYETERTEQLNCLKLRPYEARVYKYD